MERNFIFLKYQDEKEKIKVMELLLELIQLMEIWENLLTGKVINPKHKNKALRAWGLKLHSGYYLDFCPLWCDHQDKLLPSLLL